MNRLAKDVAALQNYAGMSKDRKEIYLSDELREMLKGRPYNLTTFVKVLADRYRGMLARANPGATTLREDDVFLGVIAEFKSRPLMTRDIVGFPALVADWLDRHPDYPKSAYVIAAGASFVELVAIIDRLERLQKRRASA